MTIEKYSRFGIEQYRGVTDETPFNELEFTLYFKDDTESAWRLWTNMGHLYVFINKITDPADGGGKIMSASTSYRFNVNDIYNDNYWYASGNFDVRYSGAKTMREAIDWVKKNANEYKR